MQQPITPLMNEHRLIERMLVVFKQELETMSASGQANPWLIEAGVDFFKTYADATHHGKEEEILFRDLETKDLSDEHKRVVNELIEEHRQARELVSTLLEKKQNHVAGDATALDDIVDYLKQIIDFYPPHIEKEDHYFFPPSMNYFSDVEKTQMIDEFAEVDQRMIHEKYKKVVVELER